jgi:hypothetical protein
LKDYERHILDSRKTDHVSQQSYAICGEKILDFSFQSIDHAFANAENEGRLVVCPGCWFKIENTMKNNK